MQALDQVKVFAVQRLTSGQWLIRVLSDDPLSLEVVTVAMVDEATYSLKNFERESSKAFKICQ